MKIKSSLLFLKWSVFLEKKIFFFSFYYYYAILSLFQSFLTFFRDHESFWSPESEVKAAKVQQPKSGCTAPNSITRNAVICVAN